MKRTIKELLVILIVFTSVFTTRAGEIEMADSAYVNKDYKEAVRLYNSIIESEGTSASILYNLGNAYYKVDDDGNAIVCYERALRLDPGNQQIKSNLEFLKSKINDRNTGELGEKTGNVSPDEPSFLENIYAKIAIDHNSNMWAVLAVISFLLFLGGLAFYTFTPMVLARKTGFFSALVFLLFTIFFLYASYLAAQHYNSRDKAVLMEYASELLETPVDGSPSVTTRLHRGTEVEILEEKIGNDGALWYKVRLNNTNIGWIKSQFLEII